MLRKMLLLGLAALCAAAVLDAEEIDLDYFYQNLADHGEWFEIAPYGWVWTPDNVEAGWKPYADGWWVYTDFGWTFASEEPWAWAVYHYGRWLETDNDGWVWVPGTEWGPAWVAWRYSDESIGWAPLPPRVGWSAASGLIVGNFNFNTGLSWSAWIFVEPRWFAEPRVRDHYQHVARNREWIGRTKVVVRYTYVNHRVFNVGYPIRDAERHWGKKIDRRQVVEAERTHRVTRDDTRRSPQTHPVYRPVVKARHNITPRDLPDKRRTMNDNEMRKRQETERKRLDDFYGRQKQEIREPVATERPKKEPRKIDTRKRNVNEERNRIDELERKDKRVLDNRQKREAERIKKRPRQ